MWRHVFGGAHHTDRVDEPSELCGHDLWARPEFRFTVGRAIYKGLARFMAERKGRDLVIQPLPVHDFMIKRTKDDHYRLSWKPTDDPLEPTAKPDTYIIMERSGDDLGFHKIGQTKSTHFDIKVTDHDIHSFYIIAANAGGKAFPSETLALREAAGSEKPMLIVNGFTRISAPDTMPQKQKPVSTQKMTSVCHM